MSKKIRVGVVGATGYIGLELATLLCAHPHVRLGALYSRDKAGQPARTASGHAMGAHRYAHPDDLNCAQLDVLFTATPNGYASSIATDVLAAGCKLLDMAADYRLSAANWRRWYGDDKTEHPTPDLLARAVYGLAEHCGAALAEADIVAVPGCYPTSVLLPLLPLLRAAAVTDDLVIADCKSGVTGAGRTATQRLLAGELMENFSAYGVGGHRHQIEMVEKGEHLGSVRPRIRFVPHLLPLRRGILATLHLTAVPAHAVADIDAILRDAYSDAPFVQVRPPNEPADLRAVVHSNDCIMSVCAPLTEGVDDREPTLCIVSVLDNLMKGAAGQGVQCMNIAMGLEATAGLPHRA